MFCGCLLCPNSSIIWPSSWSLSLSLSLCSCPQIYLFLDPTNFTLDKKQKNQGVPFVVVIRTSPALTSIFTRIWVKIWFGIMHSDHKSIFYSNFALRKFINMFIPFDTIGVGTQHQVVHQHRRRRPTSAAIGKKQPSGSRDVDPPPPEWWLLVEATDDSLTTGNHRPIPETSGDHHPW